jgi:hypothetical protein
VGDYTQAIAMSEAVMSSNKLDAQANINGTRGRYEMTNPCLLEMAAHKLELSSLARGSISV